MAEDRSTDIATHTTAGVASALPELRRVVVIEGPDAGATFELDASAPSRILVGTSPVCHVRLSDATVSRRHAAFEPGPRGAYRLVDLEIDERHRRRWGPHP
jgi:hypothetical protein